MAADGSVVFSIGADDAEAQKKLNQLRKDIEKTEKAINSSTEKRSGIAESLARAREEAEQTAQSIQSIKNEMSENQQFLSGMKGNIDVEEFNARNQAQKEMTYELKQQEAIYARQSANVAKLEGQEANLTSQIETQTAKLETQKEEAGAVERVIAQQSSATMPQLKEVVEGANQAFKKGFKNILKWGFGIRSAFILIRRLKSAIKEGINTFAENDPETKANLDGLKNSLTALKASWGAAFAPIVNAVAPLLQKLIGWLATAANAVQQFFAVLGGKSSYKKAIANNNALADSISGAGGAAKDAKKELLGFDEITKLGGQSSGGGGGGGESSAFDFIEEQIDEDSLISSLALRFQDVFFDWDDLSAEQIASKFLTFIYGLSGAIVGFSIGGPLGALVGTLVGLGIGLYASTVTFNGDGKIDENEFLSVLKMALGGIAGAVIGIALGAGAGGVVLAITLGISLALVLDHIETNPLKGKGEAAIQEYIDELDESFKDAKPGTYQYQYYEHWKGYAERQMKEAGKASADGYEEGVNEEFTVMGWLKKTWQGIVDNVKTSFGIHSPSTVFADIGTNVVQGFWNGISDRWTQFITDMQGLWTRLRTWWDSLSLTPFHIPSPHFEWTYSQASGLIAKALEFVGLPATIPHLNIAWYAKGGIVDGATLFGAGEAGKEAIVPLERNTEWVGMVAKGIADKLTGDNRLADYITGRMLPAIANGSVVPPRAISGGGSMFTDGDIQRLVNGLTAAFSEAGNEEHTPVIIDGRVVAEIVTRHQRRMERGYA